MAGITPQGFDPKTASDIREDINTRATSEDGFGPDFPTTVDSTFGVHTWILIGAFIDLWNQAQKVADNQNRDTAEGVYLDYLAGLIGIERLPASGSTGFLNFEGQNGTVIQPLFAVADTQDRVVLAQEELTLDRSNCYTSTFSVALVTTGLDYVVVAEGDSYTYTATAFDDAEAIIDALVTQIGVQPAYTATKDADLNLVLTYNSPNNLLTTTNSSTLTLVRVGAVVTGEAADVGDLSFPANTVTRLVSTNLQIDSVNNPLDFTEGRFRETDEQLRDRMAAREQATGTATKPAIETTIAQIDGVTNVLVVENIDLATDGDGRPGKSYETFVEGGADGEIAQAIWTTKPASIETYGDITSVVTDENGTEQAVKWSRKAQLYAWVRVDYTISTDPSAPDFPTDGEYLIRQAVVSYGESLPDGTDFIPNQYYGPVYSAVGSSVIVNSIEIATTPNAGDTPTYATSIISVDATENLNFDTVRVELTTS